MAPVVAAEITTDLWVYNYGDTVTVTGVDYAPLETVEMVTTDPNGAEVDRGQAAANDAGGFSYQFALLSDSRASTTWWERVLGQDSLPLDPSDPQVDLQVSELTRQHGATPGEGFGNSRRERRSPSMSPRTCQRRPTERAVLVRRPITDRRPDWSGSTGIHSKRSGPGGNCTLAARGRLPRSASMSQPKSHRRYEPHRPPARPRESSSSPNNSPIISQDYWFLHGGGCVE